MPSRYGPHRPEDAPTTVTVGTFQKWEGDEREVPIDPAILRQRKRINELAYATPETTDAGTVAVAPARAALAAARDATQVAGSECE